jgi:hypothetical protein
MDAFAVTFSPMALADIEQAIGYYEDLQEVAWARNLTTACI